MARCKTTGDKVASKAGQVLKDPKSSKTDKEIAASALSQKKPEKKK
jgi:hypothetical protein